MMTLRTGMQIAIAAIVATCAMTAPTYAQSSPTSEAAPLKKTSPALNGFTRMNEKGVTVYRGRTPAAKITKAKKSPCNCKNSVFVQKTIRVIRRYPPTHLRTQGFYSGNDSRNRSFTQGFYSGRR